MAEVEDRAEAAPGPVVTVADDGPLVSVTVTGSPGESSAGPGGLSAAEPPPVEVEVDRADAESVSVVALAVDELAASVSVAGPSAPSVEPEDLSAAEPPPVEDADDRAEAEPGPAAALTVAGPEVSVATTDLLPSFAPGAGDSSATEPPPLEDAEARAEAEPRLEAAVAVDEPEVSVATTVSLAPSAFGSGTVPVVGGAGAATAVELADTTVEAEVSAVGDAGAVGLVLSEDEGSSAPESGPASASTSIGGLVGALGSGGNGALSSVPVVLAVGCFLPSAGDIVRVSFIFGFSAVGSNSPVLGGNMALLRSYACISSSGDFGRSSAGIKVTLAPSATPDVQ